MSAEGAWWRGSKLSERVLGAVEGEGSRLEPSANGWEALSDFANGREALDYFAFGDFWVVLCLIYIHFLFYVLKRHPRWLESRDVCCSQR